MSRRLRVLHVIQNLNYGGMERLLADIGRHSGSARFESHVLCLQHIRRYSECLGDAAVLHLAKEMGRLSLVYPGALIRRIRGIAPEVVHSHRGVWYKVSLAARHPPACWSVSPSAKWCALTSACTSVTERMERRPARAARPALSPEAGRPEQCWAG